jgi:hypothetical protein
MTTTFVTAFFKIYDEPPLKDRTIDWRLINFEKLAQTGISLLIYTCQEYYLLLAPFLEKYPNLRIGRIMEFTETETWRTISQIDNLRLPEKRCVTKDTKEYIALMNAKTEFMKYAVEYESENRDTTHFAWIDFNIFHIFKENQEYPAEILRTMTKREFQKEDFLLVPGCWEYNWTNEWSIPNEVCWRFCGGFFVGTANSVIQFHSLYETLFVEFLRTYQVLTWEVNFWSWLELKHGFSPDWYRADHNASILELSADYCCVGLPIQLSKRCKYQPMGEYIPTSTSYFYDVANNREIINTRFVNYTIMDNGSYHIREPNQHLYTRNMMNINNEDVIREMKEEEDFPNYEGANVFGLEDIRLYQLADEREIRFVCSNKNHIPNLKTRIVSGIYDVDNALCRDMRILHPPTDTYCEKNWIPLPKEPIDMPKGEYFIYKWMPFEIGRLDDTEQLRIVKTYEHNTPFWHGVRGSSCLESVSIGDDEGYLCLVHFSEEKWPRHYFHMLVLLEKGTFKPLRYSRFFYFHAKSIEFCIGFCLKNGRYCFWISNFDRDPEYLEVDTNAIELCYDIDVHND